jgi:hypothetical protein
VNEGGQIAAVVEDHVERLAVGEGGEGLLDAPDVLFLSLALPGVDWLASVTVRDIGRVRAPGTPVAAIAAAA